MSVELGTSTNYPTGSTSQIVIPDSEAPEKQLQQDAKITLLQSSQLGDTYKVLATSTDPIPNYLSGKINLSQFDISSNLITLIGFGDLTTDNLTEGSALFNATHTGEVTGSVALTIADNVVDEANLKVSNLPTDGYFLQYKDATDELTWALITSGTITSVDSGNGMDFLSITSSGSVTLGTPSSVTASTINSVTATSHTHALDESGISITASQVSDFDIEVSGNVDVLANTAVRHTHANKTLLDSYAQTEANIASAVLLKHEHSNKAILDATEESFTTVRFNKYEAYEDNLISSATSPIDLTAGILSHVNTDGNKHVPTNAAASQFYVLSSGASAGTYTWLLIDDIVTGSGATIFESTPSISTVKAVQSAYINTHIANGTTDVNHLTDAELTFVDTTAPAHIADTDIHLPAITPTVDQGKFLVVNVSDEPEWASSSANITVVGENYISAVGDVITASEIRFVHTAITAGANINIDTGTDIISAVQRGIDISPVNGQNTESISSGWAYTHENSTGNESHIPAEGASGYFLSWDGSFKDINTYVNVEILDFALAMQEDATLDPGVSPTTGDRYILLDSSNLNANFGTITGVGDNDIVEYDGVNFVVSFDSSAATASVTVTVTLDINGEPDREWYYSISGIEWRDRGISGSIFWQKSGTDLSPKTVGDDILMPTGDLVSWGTGSTYITETATNIFKVYTASTERLEITISSINASLPIAVDTINEKTVANGVTIDGILLKDNIVTTSTLYINDANTIVAEDGSSNMTFTDAVTGTKTLAELSTSSTPVEDQIVAASSKSILVDGDLIGIVDSADSNNLKQWSYANSKANYKTYFDTLYFPLTLSAPTVIDGQDLNKLSIGAIPTSEVTGFEVYSNAKISLNDSSSGGIDIISASGGIAIDTTNNDIEIIANGTGTLTLTGGTHSLDINSSSSTFTNKAYYTASYAPFSGQEIPDAAWVASEISAVALTNGSGTTANGTAVDLVGQLTADAIFDGQDLYAFNIGTAIAGEAVLGFTVYSDDAILVRDLQGNGIDVISDNDGGISLTDNGAGGIAINTTGSNVSITGGASDVTIQASGIVVTDASLKGVVYASATYRNNFTALSLIDKGYGDSHIGGQNVDALIITPTVTEDGYIIAWNNTNNEYELIAQISGDAWSDPVDSNIVPDTGNTYNIGSSGAGFKDIYLDGRVLNGTTRTIELLSSITALGYNSGNNSVSGAGLVAVGANSGTAVTTGANNTFVGVESGNDVTDGFKNTFVGSSSGRLNVSGDFNTYLGSESGFNATGNRNTYLGAQSGYTATTSDDNVFVGYGAGYYETGSDTLFIDNQLRTDEATSRTNSLIYGKFSGSPSNQTLTINASVDTPKLRKVPQTLTSSASIAMNVNNGQNANLTLDNTGATLTLSNLQAGDEGNIIITQGTTGGTITTITPTPYVINDGAGSITLTSGTGSIDILSYMYDGTNLYITYGSNYTNA